MSDDEIKQARTDALNAILDDPATHKVVVAGPGTGKTHTYKELLSRIEGPALAITFLTVLVKDLEESIGEMATVRSFHGFCKSILYSDAIPGLSHRLHFYPAMNHIFEEDLKISTQPATSKDIEKALMNLDSTGTIIDGVVRSGNYYDAVGYTDGVYRVLLHMQEEPESVPKFEQVVVDEYQDFSKLEVELINEVAKQSPTLVVGDDDQALYGFKHASANYIRGLCNNPFYKKLELPYCSRCTAVIVEATNHIVEKATAGGLLAGRVSKPYLCYVPDKRSESDQYPRIIHAHCTVQNTRSPIMSKYIAKRIREIPSEDAEKSFEKGYPTVLIIGPKQFTKPIYEFLLEEGFVNLSRKVSEEQSIEPLDGYRLLMRNETSRLGWRILIYCHKPNGWQSWVETAINDGTELSGLVDENYAITQREIVEALRKLSEGAEMSVDEISKVEDATELNINHLREEFGALDDIESLDMETLLDDAMEQLETEAPDTSKPSILVTSLLGSKGLQADYVFVVGLNNGHFPRNNHEPKNEEVCQLIVALTRTRKECHLLSCDRFGLSLLQPSIFTDWLSPYLEERRVNAASVHNS